MTGSYIKGFYEYVDYVAVYYDEDYEGELDWNDVSFTFVNGYTGEVVRQEDDSVLQIKDSSGIIFEKSLSFWGL